MNLFLMQQIVTALFATTNKIQVAGDKWFESVTTRQFMAIVAIAHIPEQERSLNHIAKYMGTTKQNVKQIVTSLEKNGILTIGDNPQDKRARNVMFTDEGKEIVRQSFSSANTFLEKMGQSLTEEEQSEFWRLLQKLYAYDGEEMASYH